jgi:potassium voltage-gated channel Shal-related subfamily D member 2
MPSSSIELSHIQNSSRPALTLPSVVSRFLTEDHPNSHDTPEDINDIYPPSRFDEAVLDGVHPRWRRELLALLEHPTSSTSAFLLHVFITGLIVFSAVVTTLETVPAFHSVSPKVWFGMESSLVALFTMEYVARCLAWSYSWPSLAKWVICKLNIWNTLLSFANTDRCLKHSSA